MDNRYLNYCRSNSPFYENNNTPDYWDKYTVLTPPDWICLKSGDWVNWSPPEFCEKLQGWKIHISTLVEDAEDVLTSVSEYLINKKVLFKHIATRQELINRNSKSAERASSGKFITIYPNDNKEFDEIVEELNSILKNKNGPYILSDIRLGEAPIYARYGGFLTLNMLDKFGNKIPAIVDKDSNLTSDRRIPVYVSPPDDVERPCTVKVAEEKLYNTQTSTALDNYTGITAIAFSNSGGVYNAISTGAAKENIILKEARPHTGLDRVNRNAFDRLKAEWDNLVTLKDTGITPKPNRYFIAWEHEYIEMENVGSKTLGERAIEIFPFSRKQSTSKFLDEMIDYLDQMVDIVNIIHDHGIVIGDIHPHNFIVSNEGKLKIIDLEDARSLKSYKPGGFNAFGYQPPNNVTAEQQDWWSLSRVMASLFHIARPIEIISPKYWEWSIEWITNKFGHDITSRIKKVEGKFGSYNKELQFSLNSAFDIKPVSNVFTPLEVKSEEFRNSIIDSIDYHSNNFGTIRRPYPGDIEPLKSHSSSLLSPMHGAIGVEAIKYENNKYNDLNTTNAILNAAETSNSNNCGLFYGNSGTALLLHKINNTEESRVLLDNVLQEAMFTKRLDLASGISGAIYSGSIFDGNFGTENQPKVERLLDRISSVIDNGEIDNHIIGSGLFNGLSGVAIAYMSAYITYRREEYIERAVNLIKKEIQDTVIMPGERMYVFDKESGKALPYINGGSAGLLVAISTLLKVSPSHDEIPHHNIPKLIEACRSDVYAFGGLLNGRLGIISALLAIQESGIQLDEDVIPRHVSELNQHIIKNNGYYLLVGDYYLRASLDLGTGLCGLLALSLQLENGGIPWFPGYYLLKF